MFEVYTDGAYNPVLDQGGWSAVVVKDGQKQLFSGTVKQTTNNRMEITAALEGIIKTPPGAEVTIYTDSQYLFGCMAKGWKRKANTDLFEKLDAAVRQRKVKWQWIRGDDGNPFHKQAHNRACALAGLDERASSSGKQAEPAKALVAGKLTHLDAAGRPKMVDVTEKPDTEREAIAKGRVVMKAATLDLIKKGAVAKGEVLSVAQLAGIMAAKQTPHLIPLCHPLLIGEVKVEFELDEKNSAINITATVKSTGKTGVEMEALTATAVAALTIYDMCKAVDRGMQIENIRLVRKSGGKSGTIELE